MSKRFYGIHQACYRAEQRRPCRHPLPQRITLRWLAAHHACAGGMAHFVRMFPKGAPVNEATFERLVALAPSMLNWMVYALFGPPWSRAGPRRATLRRTAQRAISLGHHLRQPQKDSAYLLMHVVREQRKLTRPKRTARARTIRAPKGT